MAAEIQIVHRVAPTKVLGRGRPKGTGSNQLLLEKIKPSDMSSCIWGVNRKKMESIRYTAHASGITLKIRRLEGGKYAIWRMT